MIDPNLLICVTGNVKHYPGNDANTITILDSDNTKYVASIRVEEVDLALYLKTTVFKKLKQSEATQLLKLIEDYGDMRADDAEFDLTYKG